ncbi:MAG: hypothetical protein ACTHMP_00860 [Thermomicrobiales bacterium]
MTHREGQNCEHPRRHVFLLTLWQEHTDGQWRAALQPAGSTERQGFATIEYLAAYLLQLTAPGTPDPAGSDARASPDDAS